ncbi:conjugal transfer protein TraF [Endozoicomonas sp. ONNA1]|uniref:conjugal transfer protein TraF n=1 Tax=Endozoicomonas sp. ONNA1 TaxID=2828740 RepID=UPI002149025E|nr:conjugal transfer protein TraF [Endozoicomonas sp. ONNA1]
MDMALKAGVVILTLLLFTNPSGSHASTYDHADKKGYWWNEEPVPDEEEALIEEKEYSPPPLPSQQKMMDMHPQQLEKLLDQHRDYALYKLTPEATTNYYLVQDVARRKARAFTALSSYVMLQNPELNARGSYPVNNPGRKAQKQVNEQQMNHKIARYRNNYALVFLTTKTCPYCKVQRNILKYFRDKNGWAIKEIDIDQVPDVALRFNAKVTPMTLLIERGSERWMPITVGVESLSVVEQNTYRAIRLLRGEIKPEQFFTNESQEGGYFDPSVY